MTIAEHVSDLARLPEQVTRIVSRTASAPVITHALHKSDTLYAEALREDGLLPGSLIATDAGWKPVETIQPGEMVLTFDNGLQRVVQTHQIVVPRASIPAHKAFKMVVPMGALGNRREMHLLPCQEVIVESDLAETAYGDPFVMIQALMLEGFFGIHRAPIEGDLRIHMITFAAEQAIYIAGATLVTARPESDFSPLSVVSLAETRTYPRLTLDQLRVIAAGLKGAAAA